MKRTSTADADCAVARSLDVIGDWWSLLIIRDALAGKTRFGEFERSLGLAKNILSARLKKLVAEGILEQVPAGDGSVHHAYMLTERGRGLYIVLAALWQWGEGCFAPGELRSALLDRETGAEVAPLELRTADGRVLGAGEALPRPL